MDLSYADIASTIALFLSLVAIFQSASHRTRDMRIKAETDLAFLRAVVALAPDRISEARNQWRAAFAARGVLQSSMANQKFDEIDSLRGSLEELVAELGTISIPNKPILSGFKIDGCATHIATAANRWADIDASIESLKNGARENRELLRR
ncbi:MAG: hypothetical protein O9289_06055 [Rhodobacteraceae bacterium]|nr:hypothetical protein [Paracoccaceae bacterium]MCZ8082750.1 hypothetical protein [Paracoccaceae bacterium]